MWAQSLVGAHRVWWVLWKLLDCICRQRICKQREEGEGAGESRESRESRDVASLPSAPRCTLSASSSPPCSEPPPALSQLPSPPEPLHKHWSHAQALKSCAATEPWTQPCSSLLQEALSHLPLSLSPLCNHLSRALKSCAATEPCTPLL